MRRAALAVLLALAAPASARAEVTVTDATGARAVVTAKPFRLSFAAARGGPRLSEVASGQSSLLEPPVPQLQFGTQTPPPPALYAPLSFLVGSRAVTATPVGQWEGTLQSVTAGGTEYSATELISAARNGRGVRFVVATSDPTGRKLVVDLTPLRRGGFRVDAQPTPSDGVATMGDSFATAPGEAFRGFGGRHDALDQRGRAFLNWTMQENVGSGSAQGLTTPTSGDTYMFPNGESAAYDIQSSFTSSAGYAFLLDRDELSQWRMASDRPDAWRVDANGARLSYVVLPDTQPVRAARRLTAITGRQPVPPKWALGTILDREVRYPSDPAGQYAQEVQSDLDALKRYGVKLDAYRIEGWQFLPRPVLARFIAQLRAMGIHPMLYFRAFVGQDTIGTDSPAAYDEAVAKGYVATRADGSPYIFVANFNAPTALIDFTNPAARAWWRKRITDALELGADGFMQDFGEQVLPDMRFSDGSTGVAMHNRLPVLYHRTTREAVRAFERRHPRRRIFFFTRSGSSGTPGTAAYENANFPGDETTDWSRSSGLASQAPDMLNRAIGGQFGLTTDIGGYFDIGPYQPTTKELFVRWTEWAALTPFFRVHGSLGAGTHTPWSYDAQTVAIFKRYSRLHARIRPLLLRLWRRADRTGMPITRPLWTVAGGPDAAAQDQEWLLGRNVLVAPVVEQGATTRRVWFPPGCWRSGSERHRGPGYATVPAALERLPWFVRCGSRPL